MIYWTELSQFLAGSARPVACYLRRRFKVCGAVCGLVCGEVTVNMCLASGGGMLIISDARCTMLVNIVLCIITTHVTVQSYLSGLCVCVCVCVRGWM